MTGQIRPASDDDWPQIWTIVETVVRAGETYTYPLDLTEADGKQLWMEQPPGQTVVCVDDEVVLGTAKMGPNKPGNGDHIGTASFMVAPSGRGRGVGRHLGEYVVQWHRESGFDGIQFNAVVETNVGAVKLWESLGFSVVGTVPGAFRHPIHGPVGLHIMHLQLN